ncbi:MAG: hypothetical protein CVT66_04850 [Actinobacteria bacterium HGW-Actinobacteria-6]|jgi:peptidoglycan hydrolase CwlO-like protein|nr:MAG: hypothetical protein CVT66_04850 [Actinobacteria bacterium HGW-Actinobacteria-6]
MVHVHERTHRSLAARVIAAAIVTSMMLATPVYAAPSSPSTATADIPVVTNAQTAEFRAELARRQARLDAFKAELDELDRELSIAAEAYNASVEELNATKTRLTATQTDLDNAQLAYFTQSALLKDRARDIYRNGELNILDTLLGSKSVADLIGRIRFLNALGESDADIASTLRAQRDQIQMTASDLETAEQKAAELEFMLKARQIEVVLRIQERQDKLAAAEADLLELLDSEAARRQSDEAALMQDILFGANKAGIEVVPGSPVETALAYHGVPYLWGGETPTAFDCSGLVLYVFKQHGVSLPHYSGAQFNLGTAVSPSALLPGDVVFFGSPIHHVGIYVGAGYFIHAPRTGDFVKLSKLADRSDYAGARRYDWSQRTAPILGAKTDPTAAVR